MKCELLNDCKFFQTMTSSNQPCIVENLRKIYCEGNVLLCARRRVAHAVGREKIPNDLHPDHIHLVPELITASLNND